MISIVACCHNAKLCAHAAQAFRSQQCQITADGGAESLRWCLITVEGTEIMKSPNKITSTFFYKISWTPVNTTRSQKLTKTTKITTKMGKLRWLRWFVFVEMFFYSRDQNTHSQNEMV